MVKADRMKFRERVKENKASRYTLEKKLPVNLVLAPGIVALGIVDNQIRMVGRVSGQPALIRTASS
jgi:hypothetical protein